MRTGTPVLQCSWEIQRLGSYTVVRTVSGSISVGLCHAVCLDRTIGLAAEKSVCMSRGSEGVLVERGLREVGMGRTARCPCQEWAPWPTTWGPMEREGIQSAMGCEGIIRGIFGTQQRLIQSEMEVSNASTLKIKVLSQWGL